jgi:hypothetical protein
MAAPLTWLTIQSADRLAAFLAQPFPPRHINADLHDLSMRALLDLIGREGGDVTETHYAVRVRLGGVSASSTSGLIEAARNWVAAVRKKQAVPA